MTPLESNPQLRKFLYTVQWVVNLALGVLGIVFTALDRSPEWLIITGAVFNFVWTYTGTMAASNTPAPTSEDVVSPF